MSYEVKDNLTTAYDMLSPIEFQESSHVSQTQAAEVSSPSSQDTERELSFSGNQASPQTDINSNLSVDQRSGIS